eukprot:TRINITY_DN36848_c0_g1_i2.p1 TRINITY_DN36848_c0_g1~~TRINITY_DN36848_c0_g1_i2.p1  ORF type:complete len:115 (-),score=14.67 TRINITY_DN36848_c0_g1_i2:816-1160(-)
MFEEPVLAFILHGGAPDGLRLCEMDSTIIVAEAEGVSLRAEPGFQVIENPGLAVCLEGAARYHLAHEVAPVKSERISVTWRWFRQEFLSKLEEAERKALKTSRRQRQSLRSGSG